MQNTVNCRSM